MIYDKLIVRFGFPFTIYIIVLFSITISLCVYIFIAISLSEIILEGLLLSIIIPAIIIPLFIFPFFYLANKYRQAREQAVNKLQLEQTMNSEIIHRTNNNLQIIIGFINTQINETNDETVHNYLFDTISRIKSISLIQDLLYQPHSPEILSMVDYVPKLTTMICSSLWAGASSLDFRFLIDDVVLPLEVAIPIGLILNEAITNSIKYGCNDSDTPSIEIGLTRMIQNGYRFWIGDNGPGVSEKILTKSRGIGVRLINRLVKQINGKLQYKFDNGLTYQIEFSLTN